ncbi:helix-turn-helix domain-containing protein [Rhodococcus sp. IEGM 1330]|uniref:helix-turn-helix domain-containing protein n=1 Tax=Rhodococcus sp. IEGM 1330 TaxID=3082225 RepID=UPI002955224D|nr:helix-turn-helix domain-containing protein [Rhodococcus sp. IEGM 1330]MDV8024005.1 helix-turn-helix domain-containing protein [Rhodococcus sp. IEGM 1330]
MTEADMPRVSKLDWLKSLRGVEELTHAEFRVLVILSTFADADLRNAYPSNERLQRDAAVSRTALKSALKTLRAKGYISLESLGGNQYGKGRANVHRVIPKPPTEWPPSSDKGGHSVDPLEAHEGGHSVTGRGSLSVQQGGHSVDPHQVIDQVIDQVSSSSHLSNARASESVDEPKSDENPLAWLDWKIQQGFMTGERAAAEQMLAGGWSVSKTYYQLVADRRDRRRRNPKSA